MKRYMSKYEFPTEPESAYRHLMLEMPGRDYPPPWWASYRKKRRHRLRVLVRRLLSGARFPGPASPAPSRFSLWSPEEFEEGFVQVYWLKAHGLPLSGKLEGKVPAFLDRLRRPGWLISLDGNPGSGLGEREMAEGLVPNWLSPWARCSWTRWKGGDCPMPSAIREGGVHGGFRRGWRRTGGTMIWSGSRAYVLVDTLAQAREWKSRWVDSLLSLGWNDPGQLRVEIREWTWEEEHRLCLGDYVLVPLNQGRNRGDRLDRMVALKPERIAALIADIRHWPYRRWLGMDVFTFAQVLGPRRAYWQSLYGDQAKGSWRRLSEAIDRKILQWVRAKYRGQSRMSRNKAHLLMGSLNLEEVFLGAAQRAGRELVRQGILDGKPSRIRQNKKSRISGDA